MSENYTSRWRTVRLADIAKVVTGTTPSTKEGRYWGGEVPFVTPADLVSHYFTGKSDRTLTDEGAAVGRPLPSNVALVTCIGTIGRVAYSTVPCTTNQQINAVIPNAGIDPLFLSYALVAKQPLLERMAGVTAVPIINKTQLESFRIRIPELGVQERIAQILQRADIALQRLERLITAKREFKRGLMQELLTGRRRLPEFRDDPWPLRQLGQILVINPETLAESTEPDTKMHYIDLSSVSNGRMEIPGETVEFSEAPSRARRKVRQHDVLFSTVRPYLNGFGLIQDTRPGLVCSTGFAVLRTEKFVDARYVFELLFSDVVGRQVHARLVGSSYPALNNSEVASMQIPWPSAPERARIGAVLGVAGREIDLLVELKEQMETQKRGLLQKLLTGELTIPVSDPTDQEPVHA